MVIKMKMPISMMFYIINKLIADKKGFTISSFSMDLRFKFSPVSDDTWCVEIFLGAVDCTGCLSLSYFHWLEVDIIRDADNYDKLLFSLYNSGMKNTMQDIAIHDKYPDISFSV